MVKSLRNISPKQEKLTLLELKENFIVNNNL
jgi:hypothetical protein